ncbi:MAG: hypothetical protein CL573_10115 [Alphaproteobacteria bacterium]|nr:hypothetical protein [Alphaproteobacteria bacterium]HCP00692.1 hypothetical protein [Rhodospirillaceae bacterium]
MRGLIMVAWIIGGLPFVAFAATLTLTDGAPLRAPVERSGEQTKKSVAPDWLRQPELGERSGISTHAPTGSMGDGSPALLSWSPSSTDEFRRDRTRAGWDRLERLAASGDQDALVFLALVRSGAISGNGRLGKLDKP